MSGRDTNHDLHLPRKSRQSFWKDPEPLRVERSPAWRPAAPVLRVSQFRGPRCHPFGVSHGVTPMNALQPSSFPWCVPAPSEITNGSPLPCKFPSLQIDASNTAF